VLKYFFIIVILFLLNGCQSKVEKSLFKAYQKNINYHHQLQKTQKLQLYKNDITKLMLSVTYLQNNTYHKKDKKDEKFIINLQIENKIDIDLALYKLLLNKKVPLTIESLKSEDKRLKDLSFTTSWSSYFLVTFPHISSKKLVMFFESKEYGKGKLHFAKVAKYVLEK